MEVEYLCDHRACEKREVDDYIARLVARLSPGTRGVGGGERMKYEDIAHKCDMCSCYYVLVKRRYYLDDQPINLCSACSEKIRKSESGYMLREEKDNA